MAGPSNGLPGLGGVGGGGGNGGTGEAIRRAFSNLSELVPRLYGPSRKSWSQRDYDVLYQTLCDCDFFNKLDTKSQEELLRTTQLVYSSQQGKMVPKLREPRQLYGFNANEFGPQQPARWPAEIQVLPESVKHIPYVPAQPEPFYKPTGLEKTPMVRSQEGQGSRVVFEYEPIVGNFFMRSRVGGARTGCTQVTDDIDNNTLKFESRFESGNLAKAVKVGEYEYELWLRNDLYTNKHTQWYYFRVENTRANVKYRFSVVNLMKPDSLYNQGMKPCMYSEKNASSRKIGWTHAGEGIKYYKNNVKYTLGKTERNYYSLTWNIVMEHDNDTVYFAHCYPYTYSDLQDYLNDISNDPVKSKMCKSRMLCRTLAGNLVYVLTITSPTKNSEEAKHRKAVVITSRVHPGESNASWMMKGFLDYLMSNSPDAKLLRDTFIFKIVPMLNPDGVIVGNYRCSLTGRDLNRNYKTMLKDSFPSVWYCKNMIRKLLEERVVVVYCDLHGHSRKHNVFIYGCENRGNPQKRLRERIFPVMLSRNSPDRFNFDSCKFKIQKSKEGTGRIVMWNMGILNSFTMEATFAGSNLGKRKGYHFSTADFEMMGFDFCDTLLDYCDPDDSKAAKILVELEDRVRTEILNQLKQREGETPSNLEDINLDELEELESSDGGSDSSVSDGLPVHLQYQMDKQPKKKRLKSRKERDKKAEKKLAADKKDNDKARPLKYSGGKRSKSRDDRSNNGVPIYTQERLEERRNSASAKNDNNYLEALTKAYLRTGVLNSAAETHKEIPHFRYTGASGASSHQHHPHPPGGMTQTKEVSPGVNNNYPPTSSPAAPEQALTALFVANHMQHKLPDIRRNARRVADDLASHVCGMYDLGGSSDPRGQRSHHPHAPHSAVSARSDRSAAQDSTESKRGNNQRHLLEISAAAARQQEKHQQQYHLPVTPAAHVVLAADGKARLAVLIHLPPPLPPCGHPP